MSADSTAALFVLLGQTATKQLTTLKDVAPQEPLLLSEAYDLAPLMPDRVKRAMQAAETYKLFFVFEGYLREFVVEVLSKDSAVSWWDKVPKDVQDEVTKLEDTEEAKSWMALGSRGQSALLTYPQLLRIMEHQWKDSFEDLVRDRALIGEARFDRSPQEHDLPHD